MIASFEKFFCHRDTEYHVLFEGRSKAPHYPIETWQLTISRGKAPANIYIFRKLEKGWVSSADVQRLPAELEMALLPWAAANIAVRNG